MGAISAATGSKLVPLKILPKQNGANSSLPKINVH